MTSASTWVGFWRGFSVGAAAILAFLAAARLTTGGGPLDWVQLGLWTLVALLQLYAQFAAARRSR